MGQALTTRIYIVSPARYVARIMSMWMTRYGWILIIPFGFCGCMAFFRWEWIVVGLALFLLVYPFILSFMYFKYGLSPESRRAIQPRRITFDDHDMTIEYYCKQTDSEGQTTYVFERKEEKNYSEVRNVTQSSEGVTIRLGQHGYDHVFVPADAFDNDADYERLRIFATGKWNMA